MADDHNSDEFLRTGGALAGELGRDAFGYRGPGALKPGMVVGAIRIERRLGEGGMGEVFEGFDQRLLRRVAVKTLTPGALGSADSKARFLQEARLLSKLDHPNICRIYDLEETPYGDYLILELVEGETLAQRIREGMSREEKLRSARGIAEALDAAHREGIIHRDLKPENVMVVGTGKIKVLDFGIARLLDGPEDVPFRPFPQGPSSSTAPTEGIPSSAESGENPTISTGASQAPGTPLTTRGMLVGTPAYMSPEQARGDGLTPASDLFALGILLQELFTETPAYDPAPTPVARIAQVAEGESKPVEGVDVDVARLIRDLKNIDPENRPSAAETVERIDWILEKPVRRRRRRWTVFGGIAVLGLLVATAVVSLRLARPEPLLLPGQEGRVLVLPFINDTGDSSNDWVRFGLMDLVAQTLDAAEGISTVSPAETTKALEVRGIDPDRELDTETVLQILDGVGARLGLGVRLVRGPSSGYIFRYTTYNIAGSVGHHTLEASEPTAGANLLAQRIAHRMRPEAPLVEVFDRFSDQPLVNQVYAMGVEALHGEGAATARPYFEVALDRDPGVQWARIRLSECLETLGEGAASKDAAEEVLEAAQSQDRPDLERAALLQLALLTRRTGEYEASRTYYGEALQLARSRDDRAGVADALRGLGAIAYFDGDDAKAEKLFKQSLELYRDLGDKTGEMYCLGNLSAVADAAGDIERAEELDTRALEIARATGHLKGIADYLNNLGVSARYQDQFDRAEELYLESLELQRRLGNRHGEANTLHNLGDLAKDQGRLDRAIDFSRRAFEIFEELDDFVGIGRSSVNLAECLLLLGREDEAESYLRKAVEWDPEAGVVLVARGLDAYRRGHFAEARRFQEEAKAASGETWRPIQEDRLEAFIEAEKSGRTVPLPLERRRAEQSLP